MIFLIASCAAFSPHIGFVLADAPPWFWDCSSLPWWCMSMLSSVRWGHHSVSRDRLNPSESTAAASPNTSAIGATTPNSSGSSHTLHEIWGRVTVMQGHAWQGDISISGVDLIFLSLLAFSGWLTDVQRPEALNFDCMHIYACIMSQALQWLKKTYLQYNSNKMWFDFLKCHHQYVCQVPWMYVLSLFLSLHVSVSVSFLSVHV